MRTIIGSVESGKRRRLAWGLVGLSLAATATAAALMVVNLPPGSGQPVPGNLAPILVGLVYPAVGATVISRQPVNPVGWLLSALGLSVALTLLASEYAIRGLVSAPGSLPAAALAAWVQSWPFGWWLAAAVALLLLMFPDGRLPSPAHTRSWPASVRLPRAQRTVMRSWRERRACWPRAWALPAPAFGSAWMFA